MALVILSKESWSGIQKDHIFHVQLTGGAKKVPPAGSNVDLARVL